MRGGYRQNAGRKKGFSTLESEKARELICRKLSDNLEPILDKLIAEAKNGNLKAIKELFDRAYGRPAQDPSLELEQEKTLEPLRVVFVDKAFDKRFEISGQK